MSLNPSVYIARAWVEGESQAIHLTIHKTPEGARDHLAQEFDGVPPLDEWQREDDQDEWETETDDGFQLDIEGEELRP